MRFPSQRHAASRAPRRLLACVQARTTARALQTLGLERMDETVVELMVPSDMVDMRVRGNRCQRSFEQVSGSVAQAGDAHARIYQHVTVPPAHMPDVAAQEGNHMRFPEQGDGVVDAAKFEPAIGDLGRHDSHLQHLARSGDQASEHKTPAGAVTSARRMEARSPFDTEPLREPLTILGAPVAELEPEADQPAALIAVRLNDLSPDGSDLRVTYGVLNHTHREAMRRQPRTVLGQVLDMVEACICPSTRSRSPILQHCAGSWQHKGGGPGLPIGG